MNEEKYVSKCIVSLENSEYPKDKLELVIVDGGSTDKTLDLVSDLCTKYNNIRVFYQKGANTSIGRNIGIKNATGDFIFNFSSHATVEKNTIKVLSTKLKYSAPEVVGVGCKDKIPSNQTSIVAIAIDSINSTILGGSLMHQHSNLKEQTFFDSISFTIYRREIFSKIGFFCPVFPAGDDAEFNLRIKNAGYKLIYTPETCVYRYRREGLRPFCTQMYRYGKSRMQINKLYNTSVSIKYLLPLFFVLYFFIPIILVPLSNFMLLLYWSSIVMVYFILLLMFSLKISFSKRNGSLFINCIMLYFIQHFAYGVGILIGAIKPKMTYNGCSVGHEFSK